MAAVVVMIMLHKQMVAQVVVKVAILDREQEYQDKVMMVEIKAVGQQAVAVAVQEPLAVMAIRQLLPMRPEMVVMEQHHQ